MARGALCGKSAGTFGLVVLFLADGGEGQGMMR